MALAADALRWRQSSPLRTEGLCWIQLWVKILYPGSSPQLTDWLVCHFKITLQKYKNHRIIES